MSIIETEKVDGIGIDENGISLALLISDHLDWENEYVHLSQLQNKINAYISFIQNKQYEQIYPNNDFLNYQIEIHFLYEPSQLCHKFLNTVNDQLNGNRIFVNSFYEVS